MAKVEKAATEPLPFYTLVMKAKEGNEIDYTYSNTNRLSRDEIGTR